MLFKALPCCLCSPNTWGRTLVHDNLKQQQAGTALVLSYRKKCKRAKPIFKFFLMAEKHFLVLWLRILSRGFLTALSWFALERAGGHDEAFDFYAVTLMRSMRSGLNLRQCRSSTSDIWDASMANGRYPLEGGQELPWFSFWLWMDLNHPHALGIKTSAGSTPKP